MPVKKEHPNTIFYWIIGKDQLNSLPQWYHISQLVQLVEFITVNQPGYNCKESNEIQDLKIHTISNRIHNISSTQIRKK